VDAPVWDAEPENEVLACDEVWVPFYPGGSDHNEFSFAEELDTLAGTCPSEFTVTRTLVAADVCGNEALPWVQILTVVDTVAPVVNTWPEDLVLTDPLNVPDCEFNALIWTDNCSDAVVDCATDTIEEFCPGSFLLERTYTVTDACGNVASVQQSILVEDVEEPVFEDLPNEVTYACDTTLSPPSIGELTLTDNQSTTDEIVANVLELDSEGDECSSFTTFRYTAVDGCGNMTEVFYTQIREDNDAPVLTTPLEDLEFICLGEVPSFDDQMFLLDVEDCQSPADGGPGYDVGLVATAVDEFEGGDCTGPDCLLTRTITVDDNCGNVAMFEQVIVVSEPPTVPELPTGFSPNNDSFNDVYRIRNAGPDFGLPPCDWLDNTTFTVFDRWGRVVYQSNDVSIPWDGSNISGRPLPVGTYFVVFEANGQTYRATVDLRR
jgi:gliding motility-associated-like protein